MEDIKLDEEMKVFAKNNVEQFFRIIEVLAKKTETNLDDLGIQIIKPEVIRMINEL